jgi:hypothetical protein
MRKTSFTGMLLIPCFVCFLSISNALPLSQERQVIQKSNIETALGQLLTEPDQFRRNDGKSHRKHRPQDELGYENSDYDGSDGSDDIDIQDVLKNSDESYDIDATTDTPSATFSVYPTQTGLNL